jgi:hypothetical protein
MLSALTIPTHSANLKEIAMLQRSQKLFLSAVLGVSAIAFSGAAYAADTPSMDHEEAQQNTDDVPSNWISLRDGATVKFTQNGIGYTMHLYRSAKSKNFDLSQLGPQDAGLKGVRLVVTRDATDSD